MDEFEAGCRWQVVARQQQAANLGIPGAVLGGEAGEQAGREGEVFAGQKLCRQRPAPGIDQRLDNAVRQALALGHGEEQRLVGAADHGHQVGIDQRRGILHHGARNHRAVLQQGENDRARRFGGMEQAIGQRAADAHGGIVEEADERSIERGMFVGRA